MIQKITDMDISVYYIAEVKLSDTNEVHYIKNVKWTGHGTLYEFEYTTDIKNALHMSEDDIVMICRYIDNTYYISNTIHEIKSRRRISIDISDDQFRSGITNNMTTRDSIDISLVTESPKLIYGWDDLSKVPESQTHKISIQDPDTCSGHIICKFNRVLLDCISNDIFHGFNSKNEYTESTKRLQEYGFNILLDNRSKDKVDTIKDNINETEYHTDIANLTINNVIPRIRRYYNKLYMACPTTDKSIDTGEDAAEKWICVNPSGDINKICKSIK